MSGVETGNPNLYHSIIASLRTGDKLNEANLRAPLIHLADNDAFLNGLVGPAGAGTKRLFKVANPTELQALIGLAEGDVIRVGDQGIYTYHTSDGGLLTVAPKRYLIAAGGIAKATWHDATNTANGLAGLSADARVPNANLRGQVVATYTPTPLVAQAVTSNAHTRALVTGGSLLLSGLEDGDLLVAAVSFGISNPGASSSAQVILEPASAADVALGIADMASTTVHNMAGSGVALTNTKSLSGSMLVFTSYLTSGQMRLRLMVECNYNITQIFIIGGHILHIRKP